MYEVSTMGDSKYVFFPVVDEEPEEKPKKRRKRMKELPKEDSSDNDTGNVILTLALS